MELSESESKYRALVDTMREGLTIVDPQETIAFVNLGFVSTLEYTEAELIGKSLAELTSPKSFEIIKQETEKRKQGIEGYFEIKMLTKNNQVKDFLVSTTPLYDPLSNYVGAISVWVNLTKDTNTFRVLENRGVFLRMILTEVSEQLLRAGGWLDILRTESRGDEQLERINKVHANLQKIEQLSKQIESVIGSSLNFSLSRVSVLDFITDLSNRLIPIASPKNCKIEFTHLVEDLTSENIPCVLQFAVEQIIRDSLSRISHSIQINIIEAPDGQLEIGIIDDGKSFYEPDEIESFIFGFYLADVLLRQINGILQVKYILPGEGTHIILRFPR
ncbi:MAG: PAS domain S-box protein [Candidatus Heimdallarchaeota archaeon]|nr:MAG: PAS domain S-box protein [Candidatus Heimdallarchaeota archaeon]